MVIVNGILSKKDLRNGLYYMLMFNISFRLMKYLGLFFIIIAILGTILEYVTNNVLTLNLALLFMGAVLLFQSRILSYYNMYRLYNSKSFLTESITYEFSEDSLFVNGETYSSRLEWSNIHSIKETDEFIFIYQTFNTAFIIPKRFFKDNMYEKFFDIVKKKDLKVKKYKL